MFSIKRTKCFFCGSMKSSQFKKYKNKFPLCTACYQNRTVKKKGRKKIFQKITKREKSIDLIKNEKNQKKNSSHTELAMEIEFEMYPKEKKTFSMRKKRNRKSQISLQTQFVNRPKSSYK
ncbi:hypothetical protein M0811_08813 [Anaeramoeba ignava]|uniref:Uncharacterized protein n=1 Tax=Anaeramoeba ignava TaxID=1746090 RepID=A0A9Q0LJ28_ANAIG|nr:hypothetical protein M0811_08813 [Anaeramoeba ignava]